MKYDFDIAPNRENTFSYKWDINPGELPMWVADMDFETAPEIKQAIVKRAEHGVFGYNTIPNEWYQAYISWWKTHHDFELKKSGLVYSNGVICSLSSIVRRFTSPNENVLMCTPIYNTFYNSIINNGARVLECSLQYSDGVYDIDWYDFEAKASDPQTSLFILCNPHNPIGKIWSRDTLERIGDICKKHNVLVVSDEIHCDITSPGAKYTPFASINSVNAQNSITLFAPSKTFNIAGIQSSALYAENESIKHKAWRALNNDEVAEPNSFSMIATIAAFNNGGEWLEQLNEYIYQNRLLVDTFLKDNIPQVKLVPGEATYLLWLDARSVNAKDKNLYYFIRKETGLWLTDGVHYGKKDGKGFLRMNIACPRSRVEDGLNRLKKAIELLN